MKIQIALLALLGAVAVPGSAFADAVYGASFSFSAVALDDGEIQKQKVGSDALVNVAQGRAPDTDVPADEVLALVFDCASGEGSLVVFDTDSDTVLVTVATGDEERLVTDMSGNGAFGLSLDLQEVGDADNSVDGGFLVVTGQFDVGPGDCPVGIKATSIGVLDVTFTDDVGTESISAVVVKGKVSFSSSPIAQLP